MFTGTSQYECILCTYPVNTEQGTVDILSMLFTRVREQHQQKQIKGGSSSRLN